MATNADNNSNGGGGGNGNGAPGGDGCLNNNNNASGSASSGFSSGGQREVPSLNIALHSAHCTRNLQKCEHCGDMVPRKLIDEHYDENHAPVICSLCQQSVERELRDLYKGLQCPQRMLACQYCEFELPAADIFELQDVCGNRTEYCQPCQKYVRLREWVGHEIQFHSKPNVASESSSGRSTLEEEESYPAEQPPIRLKPAHGLQRKQLIVTVVIAGIAILIGSILFKKRGWLF